MSDYSVLADEHLKTFAQGVAATAGIGLVGERCETYLGPVGGGMDSDLEQLPTETPEEFARRLRKVNYLSLAQEFAALKQTQDSEYDGDEDEDLSCDDEDNNNSPDPAADIPQDITNTDDTAKDVPTDVRRDDQNILQMENTVDTKGHHVTNADIQVTEGDSADNCHVTNVDMAKSSSSLNSGTNAMDIASKSSDSLKSASSSSPDSLGFDVYSIETAMPSVDWDALEEKLHDAAREQEEQELAARKMRSSEREEIRRKLAMGSDSEDNGSAVDRLLRKPNLSTRLQSGMNLQICFMNEPMSDLDSAGGGDSEQESSDQTPPTFTRYRMGAGCLPLASHANAADSHSQLPDCNGLPKPKMRRDLRRKPAPSAAARQADGATESADFLARQLALQAEAKLALAQARPMAQMQMQLERTASKKSPLAETAAALPSSTAGHRRLSRYTLSGMTIPQLTTLVTDLQSQIEGSNMELVKLLMERDELHMEQDSMLVDVEDMTRRAHDQSSQGGTSGGLGAGRGIAAANQLKSSVTSVLRSVLGK